MENSYKSVTAIITSKAEIFLIHKKTETDAKKANIEIY